MNSITQNMMFRQSLMKYAEKYGVSRAKQGYSSCLESLCCIMKKLGLIPPKPQKLKYTSKPYEQMTYAGSGFKWT